MRSTVCSIASLGAVALTACGSPPPDTSDIDSASLTGYDSGIFCEVNGVLTKVECGCPGAPCGDGTWETRFDTCSSDGNTCQHNEPVLNEVCGNGTDDDCDMLVDDGDPECSSACASREDCNSSKDDDCDGLVNEADSSECIRAVDDWSYITCSWYDPHPDGQWEYVWCNDWCVISPSSSQPVSSEPAPQPPDTAITQLLDASGNAVVGGLTLSTSVTLSFTGTDDTGVASFECSAGSGAFAPCTSPTRYDGLAVGPHAFAVRAFDTAGLVDPSPAVASVTVEAAPQTTITLALDGRDASVPNGGSTRSRDMSFRFMGSDNGQIVRFECSLDGAPRSTCTSPAVYRSLTRATHTFSVRAVDDQGISGPDASWQWTVR